MGPDLVAVGGSCPIREWSYSLCNSGILDPIIGEACDCLCSYLIGQRARICDPHIEFGLCCQYSKVVSDILDSGTHIVEPCLRSSE
jgi:hypothetical protein